MAITTYAELQTAIGNWAENNETNFTAAIPDFITFAELSLSRRLRLSWLERRSYTTPTSAFVALPDDYTGMRNIEFDYSGTRLKLQYLSPTQLDKLHPETDSGTPSHFSVHDSQIELRPAPSSDNTSELTISYYYKPSVLSDSNTSNIYLTKAPDALLFASLIEANKYTKNFEEVAIWTERYNIAVAELEAEENKFTYPQPMTIQAV